MANASEQNTGPFSPIGNTLTANEGAAIASATTIAPRAYITEVTGTVQVANITLPYVGFAGSIVLVFTDGSPGTTLTNGNIGLATVPAQNKPILFTFIPSLAKWFPHVLTALG